ncbi:MAG: Ig-like domain-containing protein, partial [Prevotella sp.]|nr:Ig-like domain-containing protein [Prevotella sp.]
EHVVARMAPGDVAIDAANFPDKSFRNYLLETFDLDGDGVLTAEQVEGVRYISCPRRNIVSLKGIEYFTNLHELYAEGNMIESVDLSMNVKIAKVQLMINRLTEINVTACPDLRYLHLFHNRLTSLDLTNNPKLQILQVHFNELSSLDISKCPLLVNAVLYGYRRRNYDDYLYYNSAKDAEDDNNSWVLVVPCDLKLITGETPTDTAQPVVSPETTTATPAPTATPKPVTPKKVSITNGKSVIINKGETVQLNAKLSPDNASSTLKWISARKSIAKVNANGVVTGVKEGSTKITVTTANKKKSAITVKVVDPYKPTKVTLTEGKKAAMKVGETLQLGYDLTPNSAKTTVKWSSSKKAVASVDKNGLVTAKKTGTAKITVTTANKKKATITITVRKQ